ncbi:MAG TPA: zinc ribbon domain-containing protein [Longimicrobium sp.]|nr:zinc ribbon domain-containing protein [Longimicrobium sp.]
MAMMILQAAPAEPALIPWWVLYVVVLGATWGLFRLARRTGWAIPLGCFTFVPVMIIALLALPDRMWLLMLVLSIVPLFAALVGFRRRDGGAVADGGMPQLQPRAMTHIPKQLLAGQPRPDSVLRSKMMPGRFAAGMPRDSEFVARMRYVSGIGEMTPQPVDLFLGGGQLWVAPLKGEAPPVPIAARNVLRVDVWPEPEGPPTLRVSWSPPAGDLTAELVMQAMPNVPPELVTGQIQAIAGVLTTAIGAEAREAEQAEIAAMSPMTVPPPAPDLRACPNCGETVPPGATACRRCATAV